VSAHKWSHTKWDGVKDHVKQYKLLYSHCDGIKDYVNTERAYTLLHKKACLVEDGIKKVNIGV